MSGVILRLKNIGMSYPRWSRAVPRLRSVAMMPSRLGSLLGDAVPVLSDVSLEVRRGRALGLIGANGAGKSTLLALMAGVLKPRQGLIERQGRLCPLLQREAGFHRDLTGRENAVLFGVLLGETLAAMRARAERIGEDSGLGPDYGIALRNYSSGMQVRLGLAVASSLRPDILLLDDHLAHLDARFLSERLKEHKRRGGALVMATHSMDTAQRFCDEVAWLEGGRVAALGDPREVIDLYCRRLPARQFPLAGDQPE